MTGQTLLPMPMGIERIFESEMAIRESGNKNVDLQLKSNIEKIVTDWVEQINDILNECSTSTFSDDNNPLPSEGEVNSRVYLLR